MAKVQPIKQNKQPFNNGIPLTPEQIPAYLQGNKEATFLVTFGLGEFGDSKQLIKAFANHRGIETDATQLVFHDINDSTEDDPDCLQLIPIPMRFVKAAIAYA